MDLVDQWIVFVQEAALSARTYNQSDRKVLRCVTREFRLDDSLELHHAAYARGHATECKLKLLRRFYWDPSTISKASQDWKDVLEKRSFNSVGFSTYGAEKKGYTAQGQCMQAVALTYAGRKTFVDVFYRTADLVMRFPADLVFLRDEVLPLFSPPELVTCHFANASIDPRFYWLIFPGIDDVILHLEDVRSADTKLWRSVLTSIGYYIDGREIAWDRFNRQRPKFMKMVSQKVRDQLKEYIEVNRGG